MRSPTLLHFVGGSGFATIEEDREAGYDHQAARRAAHRSRQRRHHWCRPAGAGSRARGGQDRHAAGDQRRSDPHSRAQGLLPRTGHPHHDGQHADRLLYGRPARRQEARHRRRRDIGRPLQQRDARHRHQDRRRQGLQPPGLCLCLATGAPGTSRYTTLKDLKALRCAEPGKGAATGSTLDQALVSGGLRYGEVAHVYNMGFPEMLAAMQNGAIDAAMVPEPFNTFGREQGIGVRFSAETFYPRQTIAVLLYGPEFIAKRAEVAHRYMLAYLRGVRFYNGAIKDGHFAGPNAEELIELLVRETRYKDPALYRKVVPNGCDPDGRVDRPSLEKDLAFYRANKFVENDTIGVADVVDNSFVDAALKTLGPYKPA